jgi:RNA polymerase sigma-70 factor (ECF subfamily)
LRGEGHILCRCAVGKKFRRRYTIALCGKLSTMAGEDGQITILLKKFRAGDRDAETQLFNAVYGDLKRLARVLLVGDSGARSIQATALVHEAYLRIPHADIDWQDRKHFFAVAARAMRRILVDYARTKSAAKRPPEASRSELLDAVVAADEDPAMLISVDEALTELEQLDARQAQVVEMRFYLGMTEAEIADILHLSARQVRREWQMARVWLYRRLA